MIYYNVAQGAMTSTSSDALLTTFIGDIGDTLASGLTIVLALVAVLIGLFFVVRFIFRKIGRSK